MIMSAAQHTADSSLTLYSVPQSPFASRVRLAIHAKNLPVTLAWPPGDGGGSSAWIALNPIGKIPALRLEDGTIIPESDTIVEYLADRFPECGLRPASAEGRARARLLARIVDLYLLTPGYELIHHFDPRRRDEAVVAAALRKVEEGTGHLEAFMRDDRYAVGDSLSTADCALVTALFYLDVFQRFFGRGAPDERHPRITSYWARVGSDSAVSRVLGEMTAALREAASS